MKMPNIYFRINFKLIFNSDPNYSLTNNDFINKGMPDADGDGPGNSPGRKGIRKEKAWVSNAGSGARPTGIVVGHLTGGTKCFPESVPSNVG